MAAVQLERVVKSYDAKVTVIHGLDLQINHGEFVVFVGPSGCGKSTLLRMVAGLEPISGGTVSIDGQVVNDLPPRHRDIAMVFQPIFLSCPSAKCRKRRLGAGLARVRGGTKWVSRNWP